MARQIARCRSTLLQRYTLCRCETGLLMYLIRTLNQVTQVAPNLDAQSQDVSKICRVNGRLIARSRLSIHWLDFYAGLHLMKYDVTNYQGGLTSLGFRFGFGKNEKLIVSTQTFVCGISDIGHSLPLFNQEKFGVFNQWPEVFCRGENVGLIYKSKIYKCRLYI